MEYKFRSDEDLIQFLSRELLSGTETAKILGISTARLGKLMKDGKLPFVKEQPKIFLKSIVLDKKTELELLRKKYRPYDL